MSRKPLIVIGMPAYGPVAPEVLEDFGRFMYHLGRRMPAYDFATAIKSKSEQFRARNSIVTAAQQVGADYLLMLDDDMIVDPFGTMGTPGDGSPDEYGFLERLLAHDKDVCGALYYQRGGACSPVLMTEVMGTAKYRFLRDEEVLHRLQRVDVAGGGCLLFKMKVFDRIASPWFEPEFQYGTDIQVCRKAAEAGFEVWADTSIELGHMKSERTMITSRNRQQHAMTETLPGESRKRLIAADVFTRLAADACEYLHIPSLTVIDHDIGVSQFLQERHRFAGTDAEWYREHARERVARQVWFNHTDVKRYMTEFILGSVPDHRPLRILDFGCGIGVTAFSLAERGHQVTACDIRGTGTLAFLQWRAQKHGVPITVIESEGGIPPLGDARYDMIIAMDSLEHVQQWRDVLREFSVRLPMDGVLFANNALMQDKLHPEHYGDCTGGTFVAACAENGLMPASQIAYLKQGPPAALKETAHAAQADPQS